MSARRILVKGASGAGKSTLSARLAERLELPFIELDELHHGPNWTEATAEELKKKVCALLDDQRGWVVDGNYGSKIGTLVLDRAELILWLDLPLPIKLVRLARRTARRWVTREELWNGNRETLRGVFWGREALFPWAVHSHFLHRRVWPETLAGRSVVRLRTRREVEAWFEEFCEAAVRE